MTILITGGCGYIGTHLSKLMSEYDIIIYDDLKNGTTYMNKNLIYKGCISDIKKLNFIFNKHKFDTVIHLAGLALVSESVADPQYYYSNNVLGSIELLNICVKYGIKNFIFSSSCTVYGNISQKNKLIKEESFKNPINPYGNTKLVFEYILKDYAKKYNFNYGILRYFNVCGSDPELDIGEYHKEEKRIIPILIKSCLDENKQINIYGNDFDTIDGTAIRDYTHVCDISSAHIKVLKYLNINNKSITCNIGNGQGYSIKQLINLIQEISNKKINYQIKDRRGGDSEFMVCSNEFAKTEIDWIPKYNIYDIIKTSYQWYKDKLPKLEDKINLHSYFAINENFNGDIYTGFIKDNKYDGEGTLYFCDGGIYDGNFENGNFKSGYQILECGSKIKV